MKVALTVNDFLRRAELVYPDRVAIVDEPDQPAESWGSITYREMAERARAMAAGLDELGIGVGERVAMVSHNSARLLTALFGVSGSGRVLVPINFRLVAEEVKYIVAHSGARVLLVDPELADAMADVECERKMIIGAESDAVLMKFGVEPQPWEADEDATATINYTSGTTARPKGVQLTHRNLWLNATIFGWHMGVTDRDVYLHTLPQFHCNGWGMLYAVTGMGAEHIIIRKIDGAEILRRVEEHGVTLMCGAPAVLNMVLDAAATWEADTGRPIPGRDQVRIVVAGAPPPTRTIERTETELGWEFVQIYGLTETTPVITMNRTRAEFDDLDPSERAVKLSRAGAPVVGCTMAVEHGRRDPGPRQHGDGRLLGAARPDRRRHPRRVLPHRRRRHHRRRPLRRDLRPQEGRHHLRRRERVVDRGRRRDLPASRRHRGRRDRHPRREVGRAGDRARRHQAPGASSTRPT